MSVRFKLLLIVLFVALVPLGISAYTALGIHRSAYDEKTAELHGAVAAQGATLARARLDGATRSLAFAARSLPWADLSAAERDGAMWLVYRQDDDVAAVALADVNGTSAATSAYLDKPSDERELAAHPAADASVLAAAIAHAPTGAAGVATGELFSGLDGPLLPIVIPIEGKALTVIVALSMRQLCASIERDRPAAMDVLLVDGKDRVICPLPNNLAPAPAELAGALQSKTPRIHYIAADGDERIATVAPVLAGLSVVAQQSAALATRSSRRMTRQTLFWIGVSAVLALGLGLLLAQAIANPVRDLTHGAEELAAGNLAVRLPAGGRDELGRLATTFNRMSTEIEKRDTEIRAWNQELAERVEARTRELRAAEDQLLESRKLAAMSSLAAGVAHEINNPLTTVLGFAQVLKHGADGDQKEALEMIEAEAQRIREIVHTLLSLSRDSADEFAPVDATLVVDDAIAVHADALAKKHLEVVRDHPGGVRPIRGHAGQLRQVIAELIKNALAAVADGGRISISTASIGGELVKIVVADNGRGIPAEQLPRIFEPFFTTKQEWQGRGLGLTACFRLIERHGGKIEVASEVGQGTTVTVTIPAAGGGAHLA